MANSAKTPIVHPESDAAPAPHPTTATTTPTELLTAIPDEFRLILPICADFYPASNWGITKMLPQWSSILPLHPLLPTIAAGIHISLQYAPPLPRFEPEFKLSAEDKLACEKELDALALAGRIELCEHPLWVHAPFFVTQASGKRRLCFDMSNLGSHAVNASFKMEGLKEARLTIDKHSWLTKIDLKDAYHSITVATDSRDLLAFRHRNAFWRWNVLPFGLSTAPRLFTRILKAGLSPLRMAGVRYVQYLDDILIIADTQTESALHTELVATWLIRLGFQIGIKKSNMVPAHNIDFLGFHLDGPSSTITATAAKIASLRTTMRKLLACTPTNRKLAQAMGTLSSLSPAVLPAFIHQRWMQDCLRRTLSKGSHWDSPCPLDKEALGEISWWLTNMTNWTSRPLRPNPTEFDFRVQTDASASGWGVVSTAITTNGLWSASEKAQSSNWREATTALYALRLLAPSATGKSILLESDNTTTVALIQRGGTGASRSLIRVAKAIWEVILSHRLTVQAVYLPGVDNIAADRASRLTEVAHLDYGLSWKGWESLLLWAGYQPSIDLFASDASARCAKYYSWAPDPNSAGLDAFCQVWPTASAYAFPPPTMILRVATEVTTRNQQRLLLVTPNWPGAPWFPILQRLRLREPLWLPPSWMERIPSLPHPPTTSGSLAWLIGCRRRL